jgi:antitoxin component HigA of HigAB toxin-antitoxin module
VEKDPILWLRNPNNMARSQTRKKTQSRVEGDRYLIENRATTQTEVATDTGIAESTISEILAGKRELNWKHIEALARHFHVNPAVFMKLR